MIKFFLTSCIVALSLASVSLSACSCDGKGKLVDDGVPIAISTK